MITPRGCALLVLLACLSVSASAFAQPLMRVRAEDEMCPPEVRARFARAVREQRELACIPIGERALAASLATRTTEGGLEATLTLFVVGGEDTPPLTTPLRPLLGRHAADLLDQFEQDGFRIYITPIEGSEHLLRVSVIGSSGSDILIEREVLVVVDPRGPVPTLRHVGPGDVLEDHYGACSALRFVEITARSDGALALSSRVRRETSVPEHTSRADALALQRECRRPAAVRARVPAPRGP